MLIIVRLQRRLFLFNRGKYHGHALALERRHALGTAELFELDGETQELLFALVLEHDGPSAEKDGGLDLGTFLEEALSVLELELEVVFIGIGAEAYLLDDDLRGVGLHLLGLLPLLVEVLLVVKDLAHGGIGFGSDLDEVETLLLCHLQSLCEGIDALLGDVFPDKTHLGSGDLLVDVQFIFTLALIGDNAILLLGFGLEARRLRSVRRCDK